MTPEVVVRRASADEAPTVTAILAAAFEPLRDRYTPAAFAATVVEPDAVRQRMREGPVWLARLAGHDVGTFAAKPDERGLYLRGMGVLPGARGAGAGQALMGAALEHAVEIGAPTVWLLTTEFLHAARRLYASAGFHDETPSGDPPHLHGTPLVPMARPLRPPGA